MDFTLSKEHRALQEKAKAFTEEVIIPYEMEVEENNGISPESQKKIISGVMSWGFNGMNHSKEHGGQGYSLFEQLIIGEQIGVVTGAMWDCVPYPSFPMKWGTKAQIEEFLIPCCQSKRRDCYAITEADAGSDPTQCLTRSDKCDGGYKINGEKWYVTCGNVADFIIVHTHLDGDPEKATVFFVDKNAPGVSLKRTPEYTHHFAFKHPEYTFKDVVVDETRMLGKIGDGFNMTKDWFVEARFVIAAHCLGAAQRVINVANDFAAGRVMGGHVIRDYQAIEHMLVNMTMDLMSCKSLVYRVVWEMDHTDDRKKKHAYASMIKLAASEMENRVTDMGVQILGGRGYMRENPVERLWRDARVDRIWEGTSEIQRNVIIGQIKKRGVDLYTSWPYEK